MHQNFFNFLVFIYLDDRYRYVYCMFKVSPLPQEETKAHASDTAHIHVLQYFDTLLFPAALALLTALVTSWYVRLRARLGLDVTLEVLCLSSYKKLVTFVSNTTLQVLGYATGRPALTSSIYYQRAFRSRFLSFY